MGFLQQLGGLLSQFQAGSGNPEEHFDKVAQVAPPSVLSEGLAAAFRSDQTPPFAQMAAQMFGNANGGQQASILNTLLASAGPAVLSQLAGNLPGLSSLLQGGATQLSPDQAAQVPSDEVQHLAAHLEKHDSSIVDQLSAVYAEHPTLIKTLGGAALSIALAKIAERK